MASPCWKNAARPPQQKSHDRFRVLWRKAFDQNNALLIKAKQWQHDALEDGWRIEGKIYVQEPLRRACSMTKDNLRAIIISRDEPGDDLRARHLPAACVTVWKGQREIPIGLEYDWNEIAALAAA